MKSQPSNGATNALLSRPGDVPFLGAHFPAPTSYSIVPPETDPPEVDVAFVASVAALADAEDRVVSHHSAVHNFATCGRLGAARAMVERLRQIVASGERHCAQLSDELAMLQPDIVRPGGDQERTSVVRAKIVLFLGIAVLCVLADYLLIRMLVTDIKPELARDFWGLLPLAVPVLLVMAGLKAFPVLRYKDEINRIQFERSFAAVLPWLGLPLLGGLAWRLSLWGADPVQSLLANSGSAGRDLAVTVAAYFLQLGGQTIVGTAALCAAERLAYETRPSSSEPNKAHADLKDRLDDAAKLQDDNGDTLGWAEAKLSTAESELQIFVGQARAALEQERAHQEAEERSINLLRRRAGTAGPILHTNHN